MPIEDMTKRAEAFGMESMEVDGQSVGKVYEAARQGRRACALRPRPGVPRRPDVPLSGHYIGDPQVYRPKEDQQRLRETEDPVDKLRAELDLSDDEFEELDKEVTELVEASVEFAKAGTDLKPEDALKNVYA